LGNKKARYLWYQALIKKRPKPLCVAAFKSFVLESDGFSIQGFGSTGEVIGVEVIYESIPKVGFYFLFFSAVFVR